MVEEVKTDYRPGRVITGLPSVYYLIIIYFTLLLWLFLTETNAVPMLILVYLCLM